MFLVNLYDESEDGLEDDHDNAVDGDDGGEDEQGFGFRWTPFANLDCKVGAQEDVEENKEEPVDDVDGL